MPSTLTGEPAIDHKVVVSTRVFAASREHLFGMFADPECLARWWGPKGFSNTIHRFDLKPGGRWRFEMHGPDGAVYRQDKEFLEVSRPSRIAFRHYQPSHQFDMIMSFDEAGEGTRLTWRMEFGELDAEVAAFIARANEENFDRLDQELAAIQAEAEDRTFVITRVFSAAREAVWRAWTQPALLGRWWGPHSFTNPISEIDLQVGGFYRVVMQSPEGVDYPINGAYREIIEPVHLVMTMDCSEHPDDWQNAVRRHGGADTGNAAGEMLLMVSFDERAGKTHLTVRIQFISSDIRDAMLDLGMEQGWSQSLDRLQRCLASRAAQIHSQTTKP